MVEEGIIKIYQIPRKMKICITNIWKEQMFFQQIGLGKQILV